MKRTFLFLSTSIALTASVFIRQAIAGPPPEQYFRLQNGLRVVLVQDMNARFATVTVGYRAGSAADPPRMPGMAYVVSSLMFAPSVDNTVDFMARVRKLGGRATARVGRSFAVYTDTVPVYRLSAALQLEASRMQPRKYASREVQAVIMAAEETASRAIPPTARLLQMLYKRAFYNTALAFPPGGTPLGLSRIRPENIYAFEREYITPTNAALVVRAPVSFPEMKRTIELSFSSVNGNFARTQPELRPSIQGKPIRVGGGRHNKKVIAFKAPSTNDDDVAPLYIALQLLSVQTRRERGTIGVNSRWDPLSLARLLVLYTVSGKKTHPLNNRIETSLYVLSIAPIDQDDLRRAKDTALDALYGTPRRMDMTTVKSLLISGQPQLRMLSQSTIEEVRGHDIRAAVRRWLIDGNAALNADGPIGRYVYGLRGEVFRR